MSELFQPAIASTLALASRWSYCLSKGDVRSTNEILPVAPAVAATFAPNQSDTVHIDFGDLKGALVFDVPDTSFAALLEFENYWALVFEGTVTDQDNPAQSIRDWVSNFHAGGVAAPELYAGKAHKGFLNQYRLLHGPVQQHLSGVNWKGKPLYLCGHSQGGAMVQLAMAVAQRQGWSAPIAAGYIFGSPRAGDEHFVSSLLKPVYRFECAGDPVPHLPPSAEILENIPFGEAALMMLGVPLGQTRYVSPGTLYFAASPTAVVEKKVGQEAAQLASSRARRILTSIRFDHHPPSIYCNLAAQLAAQN